MASDKDLINLSQKSTIKKMEIKHSEITYKGYQVLKDQPIKDLRLYNPFITPKELAVFSTLPKLKKLSLRNNLDINDELIVHLVGPKQLEALFLRNIPILLSYAQHLQA